MQPIVEMVNNNDKEALDKLNQYNVQNAWFKVDFWRMPLWHIQCCLPGRTLAHIRKWFDCRLREGVVSENQVLK